MLTIFKANLSVDRIFESFLTELWLIARIKAADRLAPKHRETGKSVLAVTTPAPLAAAVKYLRRCLIIATIPTLPLISLSGPVCRNPKYSEKALKAEFFEI